jgi:hypothetical protein
LRRSSDHLRKFDKIFLKLKLKENCEDFIEDLPKNSKRVYTKILRRSQKGFYWRSFEDLLNILVEDPNKIQFEDLVKISKRFS